MSNSMESDFEIKNLDFFLFRLIEYLSKPFLISAPVEIQILNRLYHSFYLLTSLLLQEEDLLTYIQTYFLSIYNLNLKLSKPVVKK